MKAVKIKNKIALDGSIVVKGNLILVKSDEWSDLVFSTSVHGGLFQSVHYSPMKEMGDYYVKPVIISETEEINVGDKFLIQGADPEGIHERVAEDGCNKPYCNKILAMTENLSPDHLRMITSGKLKDKDVVFVECEFDGTYESGEKKEWIDWYKIKLDEKCHISILYSSVHPERQYTFEQLLQYQTSKGYSAVDFQSKTARGKLEEWFDIIVNKNKMKQILHNKDLFGKTIERAYLLNDKQYFFFLMITHFVFSRAADLKSTKLN